MDIHIHAIAYTVRLRTRYDTARQTWASDCMCILYTSSHTVVTPKNSQTKDFLFTMNPLAHFIERKHNQSR
jgi:hypothetical protein